jgi:hypothetical protein
MTDKSLTADESLATPPGTADVLSPGPPVDSDVQIEYKVQEVGGEMKLRFKFFQLSQLNEKEELKFTEDFEGWEFVGMCGFGPRVVVLGRKFMPVQTIVVEDVPVEIAHLGELSDEVDEKEASQVPVEKVKVVNPFDK